jgi:hypothetical protein
VEAMTLFRTSELASIFVSDNGRVLSLTFRTDAGTVVELEFPGIQMRPIVQQIMGAVSVAEARSNLSKQGVVAVMNPAQTGVGTTEDGQDVFVAFRIPGDIEYKFALPSNEALRLGQRIVEEAQKNSGTSKPSSH